MGKQIGLPTPVDSPPWWRTPKRSAWRAACWLLAGAWVVVAVKRALWTEPTPIGAGVVADCGPTPAPIVADLLIAAAGVGLVVFSLNVAPPSPLRRIVLIAIVAALWGAVAYGWLPHNPQNCVN